MATAYQKELCEIREYSLNRSCLLTKSCKIKGNEVVIHSGFYDQEFIAYTSLPTSMFKKEAIDKFVVTRSVQVGDYVWLHSKGSKSLKDIIRKNLKEQL
jgi:hypothetical protein